MLKQIHLIHHTHMDVGYTDLPTEVLDQQLGYLDTALNLCEGNDSLPPERQFRWTVESALLVQDYLACRGEAQRERLLRALRRGWIELQAFLTQPLTELASAEEMIELVRYAAELGRREGFPVQCGVVDDIGGYAARAHRPLRLRSALPGRGRWGVPGAPSLGGSAAPVPPGGQRRRPRPDVEPGVRPHEDTARDDRSRRGVWAVVAVPHHPLPAGADGRERRRGGAPAGRGRGAGTLCRLRAASGG